MTPDLVVAILFFSLNGLAFAMFGIDKWQARLGRRRISERALILCGALGGWFGGLMGMSVFRHKTRKTGFAVKYALAVLPFAAALWTWFRWR
jgi:uncharacterized membrane protein YsdA (DUF1294 family)